jgi:acyl carrier protein
MKMNISEFVEWLRHNYVTAKDISFLDNVTDNTLLADLNFDSLDVIEISMLYEDQFIKVVKDPIAELKTIGDLLDLIND